MAPWTGGDCLTALVVVAVLAFVWHCPIVKPWFGFRKPPGARGRWGE